MGWDGMGWDGKRWSVSLNPATVSFSLMRIRARKKRAIRWIGNSMLMSVWKEPLSDDHCLKVTFNVDHGRQAEDRGTLGFSSTDTRCGEKLTEVYIHLAKIYMSELGLDVSSPFVSSTFVLLAIKRVRCFIYTLAEPQIRTSLQVTTSESVGECDLGANTWQTKMAQELLHVFKLCSTG
ncbi:hypothetical protein E2C01_052276 [Portunus trituberculatus]|uniref:Uncharacterized protein n=1 Tax=Portunus trituberculatus TaxID=210409 RepID=A0A5B7GD88_PORTR|nr:hypothetical protein [Portunus trituberculatus]